MTQRPRIPGSQVAPGQKPFQSHGRTATTHSKVPLSQAHEGKTFRVRDKDWVHVWGEALSWDDAVKLREQVVTGGKSKTARVEDEEIPPPDWYMEQTGQFAGQGEGEAPLDGLEVETEVTATPSALGESRTLYSLDDGGVEISVPALGVVTTVLAGHELVVNGHSRSLPAVVVAGDRVMARPVDPVIIAARARALAAAASAARPAKPRAVYRDRTVRSPEPRRGPLPKDKTATSQLHVRLAAAPAAPAVKLPSVLKVATLPDGAPLDDNAIGDDDIHDLSVDVGGGASDADIDHARRQRDAEKAG